MHILNIDIYLTNIKEEVLESYLKSESNIKPVLLRSQGMRILHLCQGSPLVFFLFNNNHSLLVFCQRIFLVTLNFFFWLWVSSVNIEEDNYSWENRYGILWFKTSSISKFFFIFFQLQSFKNVLLLNKSPTYNDFCDISYFIERLISADWFNY